ncbi:MAG: hypothetical protein KIT14_21045 [bacterium]|nr:hypothetical protein [bacterium]
MRSPYPLSSGAIVRASLEVYRRQFTVLFVTAALLGLPGALAGLGGSPVPESGGEILALLAVGVVEVLASVVAIVQVAAARRGAAPTLAGGVTAGAQRLLSVLGALGLSTVWVMAVAAPMAVLAGGVWVVVPRSDDPQIVALEASVLLLVVLVPATWMMLRYFFVVVVAALEPGTPPLRRSAALARGAYWKLGVVGLVGWLAWMPATVLPWADSLGGLVGDGPDTTTGMALQIAAWLAAALAVPFSAALTVLVYDDQRARTDAAA